MKDNGVENTLKAVEALDEQHRREHHEMPPVVYPAVDAAFVVHYECLERTEEQYAHVVAEIECYGA